MYQNKELVPVPSPFFNTEKGATLEAVDEYTVKFTFPESNSLFAEVLASFFEKDFLRGQKHTHYLSDAPVSFLTDYDLADDFPWYMQARDDKDLAAHSPLENFSLMGYTQSVYEKPAKGLKLMNKAVGDSVFRDRIHKYY